MCLAVPLVIVKLLDSERALARQGETELEVDVSLVPGIAPGDYAIVHAGFAIQRLELDDAEERIELLRELTDPAPEVP